MKKKAISQFGWLIVVLAAGASLSGSAVFAADATPSSAKPAQPASPDTNVPGGGRGNRIRGGNIQPGNLQNGVAQGGVTVPAGRGNAPAKTFSFGGLNLDEKQNELLREAMRADSDELRKLADKLQDAQKELVKVIVAEKYDEKSLREKAEAVARIQTEITVLRGKAFATISPTLKPEQRDQIENSRGASALITGAGIGFGGNMGPGGPGFQPQDRQGQPDRGLRRNNNAGDPTQLRRRGGNDAGTPGQ